MVELLVLGFPDWPLFLPITFSGHSRLLLFLWALQYPSNKYLFQPQLVSPVCNQESRQLKTQVSLIFKMTTLWPVFTRMQFLLRIWGTSCHLWSLKDILEINILKINGTWVTSSPPKQLIILTGSWGSILYIHLLILMCLSGFLVVSMRN